jgi:hypothetical protein
MLPSLSSLHDLQGVRAYDPACDAADERYCANAVAARPGVMLLLDAAEPCPAAARALNLLAACSVRFNTQLCQPV